MSLLDLSPGKAKGFGYTTKKPIGSLLGPVVVGGQSYSQILPGSGAVYPVPNDALRAVSGTTMDLSLIYPLGSAQRTTDAIGDLLRQFVPGVSVRTRAVTNIEEGPFPVLVVSPVEQKVQSAFVGYAGNRNGTFNRYCVRYIGLPASREVPGYIIEEAENKFWFHLELIIKAFKKDQLGNLGGACIRAGDEIDISYSESGPQIWWRGINYVGGVVFVSVMEHYRLYGQ